MAKLLIALALATPAAAFAPVQTQARAVTSVSAYVPAGLTEAQYKAQLNQEKGKTQANKSRFPKGKKTLDIADWLPQIEKRQKFKGDKVMGSGHTFAKNKYESKAQFDAKNGKSGDMWE